MDQPERTAAIEYLRRKGTEAPVSKLLAGLRSTFRTFEQTIERVPEAVRPRRPGATEWSVHEIVDHLVETHRPAVLELRALCAGRAPDGGPIPARLRSANPFDRPWAGLVADLKDIHAKVVDLVAEAGGHSASCCEGAICHGREGSWSGCCRGHRVGRSARLESLRTGVALTYSRALRASRANCGSVPCGPLRVDPRWSGCELALPAPTACTCRARRSTRALEPERPPGRRRRSARSDTPSRRTGRWHRDPGGWWTR